MGLDIRLPIGLMFLCLGPILLVTGLVNDTPMNTYTGSAMLIFGIVMLAFGVLAQRREKAEAVAAIRTPRTSAVPQPDARAVLH